MAGCSGGGCGGCGGPSDPMQASREGWRALLFLVAVGAGLLFLVSR
ncbi:MAG: hypothetical protein IT374_13570 [Polyangiaceae bacterium]|nr:hypothetical protein [Polyangiaceae bacterium]